MTVALLAGGRGTRVNNPAKCWVSVNGRPFISRVEQTLRHNGVDEIVWCCAPTGTGGAVKDRLSALPDEFLVLNGDTWFDCDFSTLPPAPAMIVTHAYDGNVWLYDGKVVRYEKTGRQGHWLDLGGLYNKALFDDTPQTFDMDLIIQRAITQGLNAHLTYKPFYEVGSEEGLRNAKEHFDAVL